MPAMRRRLAGRVALVTGGGRGIGRAIALSLARQGAAVVVNDLGVSTTGEGASEEPAETVAKEIVDGGGAAVATVHSVADPQGPVAMVDAAMSQFGRLDVLVNNAGIVHFTPFTEITPSDWDLLLGVHVAGHLGTIRAALPHMRAGGYGRIINFISGVGVIRDVGLSSYPLAKRAVAALTVALGRALAGTPITVNAISPFALTRMVGAIPEDQEDLPPMFRDMPAPDLMAPLAAFLGSPQSQWINGKIVYTNGYELSLIELGPVVESVRETLPLGESSFLEFIQKVIEPAVQSGISSGGAGIRVRADREQEGGQSHSADLGGRAVLVLSDAPQVARVLATQLAAAGARVCLAVAPGGRPHVDGPPGLATLEVSEFELSSFDTGGLLQRAEDRLGALDTVVTHTGGSLTESGLETSPRRAADGWERGLLAPIRLHAGVLQGLLRRGSDDGAGFTSIHCSTGSSVPTERDLLGYTTGEVLAHLARLAHNDAQGRATVLAVTVTDDEQETVESFATLLRLLVAGGARLSGQHVVVEADTLSLIGKPQVRSTISQAVPLTLESIDQIDRALQVLVGRLDVSGPPP